jgi:hypothetical protein
LYNEYENALFYLQRNKPYEKYGRTQTLEEAVGIDELIKTLLDMQRIPYYFISGDKDAPKNIFDRLFK